MRYHTIFMDADDTILDFKRTEQEALKKTFLAYQIEYTSTVFETYSRINHGLWKAFELGECTKEEILEQRFRKTFQELGLTGEWNGFEEFYQNALSEGSFLIDGADQVCRRLSETCRLYILTNGVAFTQYRRLRESGLSLYFTDIFISEEIGYQKPSKEYFDSVTAKIAEYDPKDTLMVGDSLTSDIEGGKRAGIATCWMCREKELLSVPNEADYVIRDLRELYAIVGEA